MENEQTQSPSTIVTIKSLPTKIGSEQTVQGHVHAIRRLGSLVFMIIRDQSGLLQTVVENELLVSLIDQVNPETPVVVSGVVVAHKGSPLGVEMQLTSLRVLTRCEGILPVEIAKENKLTSVSLPVMLDYRPLTLRAPSIRSIFQVEAQICAGFREFLSNQEKPFIEINTPKLVSTGTEGGAQLFKLDYFGKTAYLAQSPQFYKQMMVGALERVYEIGPVYRAEEHDTSRHINEYVSMDVEMGFISGPEDVMQILEQAVKHIIARLKSQCVEQLSLLNAVLPSTEKFAVVTLPEAMTILKEKMGWAGAEEGDLDPSGERLLCQYFDEKEGVEFVFVTGYLQSVRPFYAMPTIGSNATCSFDLLFRGAEISTGGQRIHEYKQLVERIESRKMVVENFSDYLQCFKYGMPPHGGFAIGLERFTQQLLRLPSIKLASLFPRDCNRLTP
ncbi:MAG: aspartate--tRNA(Asn) ligase [Candidatus Obscuribacterales bacterium]|nr:aspartate--tRNA(Asn) ligase [Candidatus Obscuribacterales bacterium]